MALSVGLIGLPNAGKSTTFNVLAQETLALTASYPFSTVAPNRALVAVPDPRLDVLGALVGHEQRIQVKMELIDIAGLVAGASRGEGLGNQFLDQARHCDALLHVLSLFGAREFRLPQAVARLEADLNAVHQELMLSDLERVERKVERLQREVKGAPARQDMLAAAESVQADLERGIPARQSAAASIPAFPALNQELRFISYKPELVLVNLDDSLLTEKRTVSTCLEALRQKDCRVLALCSRLEEEMVDLPAAEQEEYRTAFNLQRAGLDRIVEACFNLLGLIRFYSLGDYEVRAWEIAAGSRAVEGAGIIHTDFAQGFIAAEVVSYAQFVKAGSEKAARAQGCARMEGREYEIRDGDVIRFRFNV